MRATAESHGKKTIIVNGEEKEIWHRNPLIAEKMVDSANVLSFTPSEAMANYYCEGMAESIEEVVEKLDLEESSEEIGIKLKEKQDEFDNVSKNIENLSKTFHIPSVFLIGFQLIHHKAVRSEFKAVRDLVDLNRLPNDRLTRSIDKSDLKISAAIDTDILLE